MGLPQFLRPFSTKYKYTRCPKEKETILKGYNFLIFMVGK